MAAEKKAVFLDNAGEKCACLVRLSEYINHFARGRNVTKSPLALMEGLQQSKLSTRKLQFAGAIRSEMGSVPKRASRKRMERGVAVLNYWHVDVYSFRAL